MSDSDLIEKVARAIRLRKAEDSFSDADLARAAVHLVVEECLAQRREHEETGFQSAMCEPWAARLRSLLPPEEPR